MELIKSKRYSTKNKRKSRPRLGLTKKSSSRRGKRKKNLFFKLCSFTFNKIIEHRENKKIYRDYDKKVHSTRCNIITLFMVILCVLFVLIEKNLYYSFPLLTCIYPFLKFSEGINNDLYNKYKDLKLYNRIIKLNVLLFTSIAIFKSVDYFFFNFYVILILIVPMYLGNLNKEVDWDKYDE